MKLTDSVSAVDFASDRGLRPVSEETFEIWGLPSLHYPRHTGAGGQVLLLNEALQKKKWSSQMKDIRSDQVLPFLSAPPSFILTRAFLIASDLSFLDDFFPIHAQIPALPLSMM